jgi:glutathione S-transferase
MLKIWGRANSSNVKKVLLTCAELDIPYERIDAGMHFGVNTTDEYKAMNPMGLIPVIDDDGYVLWESNAIIRYLGAKTAATNAAKANPFYPSDPKIRGQADRWMEWQSTTFGPVLGPPFVQIVRFAPEKRDMAMINTNIPKTAELWKIVDRQLGKTKWLAGDHFTMGDVPLGILMYTWMELKLADVGLAEHRVTLLNLARWYDQLQAMKNYREIVQIGLT